MNRTDGNIHLLSAKSNPWLGTAKPLVLLVELRVHIHKAQLGRVDAVTCQVNLLSGSDRTEPKVNLMSGSGRTQLRWVLIALKRVCRSNMNVVGFCPDRHFKYVDNWKCQIFNVFGQFCSTELTATAPQFPVFNSYANRAGTDKVVNKTEDRRGLDRLRSYRCQMVQKHWGILLW